MSFSRIRKRNITTGMERYLQMTLGGVPIGPGEVLYLTESGDDYETLIKNMGTSSDTRFTDLATAIAALDDNKGASLLVFPGSHTTTAAITLSQDDVRIIGVGSPNQKHQPNTLTDGAIRFTCTTAKVAYLLTVTGHYVQMYNIGTQNTANDAENLSDVFLSNSRNFYAQDCCFRGGGEAAQMAGEYGVPVLISTGYAPTFVRCELGSAGNTTRTSGPGFLKFEGSAGACGYARFIQCDFAMRSETDGANVSGILVEETSLDRLTIFNRCSFYNFSENWGAVPDYLFNIDQTHTFDILLHGGCGMVGFDIVSDSARVKTSDPLSHTNGVEALAVATS